MDNSMPDSTERPRRGADKRVMKQVIKWGAGAGALLTLSSMPCPECGAPLGLHILPLAVMLLAVRAAARRAGLGKKTTPDESRQEL